MKKFILFTFAVIFSLGAFAITPVSKSSSENPGLPDKNENKMSAEKADRLTKKTEELKNCARTTKTQSPADHAGFLLSI